MPRQRHLTTTKAIRNKTAVAECELNRESDGQEVATRGGQDEEVQGTEEEDASPNEALKKIVESYDSWSGRLTDVSLQMCYALIGADWVVFGSLNGILGNPWARLCLLFVILALATTLFGSWNLTRMLRQRIAYGEADSERWAREFRKFSRTDSPWPFTSEIDGFASWMRLVKMIFTLLGGAALIVGGVLK